MPVPPPSLTLLSFIVGFAIVDQHIPLIVTFAPPSEITFPPAVAVVCVIFVIGVIVVTVGNT